MSYTLTQHACLTPGKVHWIATDAETGRNLASGFCKQEKYPAAAHAAVKDALRRPYEVIRQSFLTGAQRHEQQLCLF